MYSYPNWLVLLTNRVYSPRFISTLMGFLTLLLSLLGAALCHVDMLDKHSNWPILPILPQHDKPMPEIHSWNMKQNSFLSTSGPVSSGNLRGHVVIYTYWRQVISASFLLQQIKVGYCSVRRVNAVDEDGLKSNMLQQLQYLCSGTTGKAKWAKVWVLLLTAEFEQAQGDECYFIVGWRVAVGLVMSLPRSTFYTFFLLPKELEKLQKLFDQEQKSLWDLRLLWAGESHFPDNSGHLDVVVPFLSLPSCHATRQDPVWASAAVHITCCAQDWV